MEPLRGSGENKNNMDQQLFVEPLRGSKNNGNIMNLLFVEPLRG